MPDMILTERNITCHIEDNTVIVDLGSDNDSVRLFLNFEEAQSLYDQIGNVLFYGDGGVGKQIVVAGVKLSLDDAFELTEQISLAHTEWCEAKQRNTGDKVNWKDDGF